ncbi:Hypothetical_protein [Hexamita inflata]|uniref:Hypothetical_protein n=1 Tax=Hexamita inflata TaxID=28002 RepID=A0ABP1KY94_9EUKA
MPFYAKLSTQPQILVLLPVTSFLRVGRETESVGAADLTSPYSASHSKSVRHRLILVGDLEFQKAPQKRQLTMFLSQIPQLYGTRLKYRWTRLISQESFQYQQVVSYLCQNKS